MNNILLRITLTLHGWLYRIVNHLAIKINGGDHPKHRIINYHQFFLNQISPDDRVLDIGCGKGTLTAEMAKKASYVVGLDINNAHRAKWMHHNNISNLEFVLVDAKDYQSKISFDVLILSNVLEHIEHRNAFLQKIKPLASRFLIRVPMVNRDWITLYKQELGLESRLDKTHFTEYTLGSFQDELTSAGFEINTYSVQFGEIWAVVSPMT